jgi:nitrile hydratase
VAFEPGARIRTRAQRPAGHTRLPAYLQRKNGVVRAILGEFPWPDENAHDGAHARLSRLYSIEFDAREIWGECGEGTISADLFEEYMENAQ